MRRLIATTTLLSALAAVAVTAHANLPPWMQQIVGASTIESALYRTMQLPGLATLYPRPPAEARTELSALVSKTPADAQLYALRAHADEQSLDFAAAERDWKAYTQHAQDVPAAQLELADFYHRRLQPRQEIATLLTVAAAPSPASEKFTPAPRQRSWLAYQRILRIAADQALPPEVTTSTYQAWIARYPAEASVRAAYINTLVQQQRFPEATTAIEAYKKAFPSDPVFPVKATALVAYRSGSPDKALALYASTFQPLWPAELVQSYFAMLAAQHQQRVLLAQARAALVQNPDDLAAAARIFFYFQQQGNLTAAARAFDDYRLSKSQRNAPWTPDELYTIATLLDGVGLYPEAARYDFALDNTPGELTVSPQPPQQAALAGLARILLLAPDQPIDLGAGNLSIDRDIATLDRGPGYLNGILSLWLNSASPASEFQQEEQRANPYFRRAKAAEILALLDKNFPAAPTRPALHADLIRAYAAYGDDAATIQAANAFLTTFPTAPQRLPVAILLADAYARTNNPTAEFALYDRLLLELSQTSQGEPLTASAANAPTQIQSVQIQPPQPNPDEDDSSNPSPASPAVSHPDLSRALDLTVSPAIRLSAPDQLSYSQLLERYLGRLTTAHKLPEALAVLRRELDRNPNDPLLYVRLADFLQQNNLAAEQEEVYRRAIARFNDTTFYDQLARFYLRHRRQQDFDTLTRKVVDTFQGTELEHYFSNVNRTWPQLYLQLNLYAHQRFPHELRFTRNLLAAYRAKGTADPAAWETLLRQHWFEATDLRNQFFDYLSRTGKLDSELAQLQQLVPVPAQQQQNPAATLELAEADLWQSHFEDSAPLLASLARAYPADTTLGDQASSVFRSLAYFDPANIQQAVAIEKSLLAADPANVDRLTRIGDIYANSADSTNSPVSPQAQLAAAAPYWRRIPTLHPGQPDGYLQAATVFWDYFQFDDALAQIAAARTQFHSPALFGYEAGAIDENKLDLPAAIREYVAAATDTTPNSAAQARLVTLAGRPATAALVDSATAQAASANPTVTTLTLRADILTARHESASIAPLVDAAIARAPNPDAAAELATFAQQRDLTPSYRHALERETTLSADPVQRIQLQYALADSFQQEGKAQNLPTAQRIIEAVYKENPRLLGVVRATTDFYWNHQHPQQAIATIVDASHAATPDLAHAFTLEAAAKCNQSGDYAQARTLLAPLLASDPYNPRYLATQADSFALAKDDAGLRTFYTSTLATLKSANVPADVRRDRTAILRQGLIQALTHLHDYPAAMDQHIALISAFPEDSDVAQSAALYALRYNLQPQLTTFLNKTVTDSPRDSRFAITLARVNTLFEDYPGAIAAYSKAIAIRKDRADLYIARADLYEHLQRFDDACADYDRLYLLTYKDPQWMEKSALARARQGKNDLAVRALQTAWIEGHPAAAQDDFRVAERLESWYLLDQARTFAEQGIKLAGDDFLASPEYRSGVTTYARILTRQRHTADLLAALQKAVDAVNSASASSPSLLLQQAERQGPAAVTDQQWRLDRIAQRKTQAVAALQAALTSSGNAVAEFYTPEEKLAYAQLLDAQRANKSDAEVATLWIPAAQAAGLKDREAQWRQDLLLHPDPANRGQLAAAQLDPYNTLEKQRMDDVTRARTLEAYAALFPAKDRQPTLLLALDAWSDAVDHPSELRLLRSLSHAPERTDLRDRYFRLLLQSDPKSLLAEASSNSEDYADAAANYLFAHGSQSLAYEAVQARAHTRPPVWGAANTALTGLFFAERSPRTDSAFRSTLGDATIADRLAHPADRNQQLVGRDWFYYGTRYGLFRTIAPTSASEDPEDFLPATLEASPTAASSYLTLAQAYADSNHPDDAAREYHHALELTPRVPAIHRSIALAYWPAGSSPSNRQEALDQWNAALSLLRAQVDLRAVPESFWIDFAAIAQDATARRLGSTLRPAMDTVLRAYIAKNGNYRSTELLQSAYLSLATQDDAAATDWIFALASAARNPAAILAQLDTPWFPRTQLGRLYRRQYELAQTAAAANASTSDQPNLLVAGVDQARTRLLTYLFDQHTSAADHEAQTLLDAAPSNPSQQDALQSSRILLAAHQSRIPALLDTFTANPASAPSLELIASVASTLRTQGDHASSLLLLEYVFQQRFAAHQLTPPDYLALAQARLDANTPAATASALELLHRLVMLPSNGDPSSDLYANLDSAAGLLERNHHAPDAISFLTTLADATPWNPAYRLRLAHAQLELKQPAPATTALVAIASASTTPYRLRAEAASTLKPASSPGSLGSAELNLLAASAPPSPTSADQPYFLPARIAAAEAAPAAAKPALLLQAIAVTPSDSLRLAIFRAELALHHDERALAVIQPLLQSPYGYLQTPQYDPTPTPSLDVSPSYEAPITEPLAVQLPVLLRTRSERSAFALAVATAYERTGDPAQAEPYLRTAASLTSDAATRSTLQHRIATIDENLRIEAENATRRPVLRPSLDQPIVVRPRLIATASQQAQKVQP
jgi:tetratricopeptide (TPR) repeat protein